ncbi:MAG: ATP-dependent Lon protease [Paraglaciecola sp.]|jgi:ATP-dependent Lon protease
MFEEIKMEPGFDEDNEFMPLIAMEEQDESEMEESMPDILPILALKNTVLFPGIVIPITVGRDKSIKAITKAYDDDRMIGVLSQKDSKTESPTEHDLFRVGTIARIVKLIKMPDGTTTAILQGRRRFKLIEMLSESPFMEAYVEKMEFQQPPTKDLEFSALISTIMDKARNIVELSPHIPMEAMVMLKNIQNPSFLMNFIASNLGAKIPSKQKLLENSDLRSKAESIVVYIDSELQLLELKYKIETKVRSEMEKQQRDYFLNQQLKTIQEELGQQNPQDADFKNLITRSKKKKWPPEVAKTFEKGITKLRRVNPQVPEYSIMMTYLEMLLDLPWQDYTKDNFNLKSVKKVLDQDHYGLEKVKNRILEHLAVLKLKGDMKAPILCLVGPPGVGKTSLGKSVAKALKRKFIRMSLGGLHDESEVRGHRRTYIGAMPGRVIQSLKKVGSANPVFILDEIDKVGKSFRGDPSSALLEVLDPEQNATFHDNYLDLEFDLSKVMFIATANSLNNIQPALLDRMEIIQVSGYSTEEKVEISKRHLVPEARAEHGLKAKDVKVTPKLLVQIIREYTRESGVRSLRRQIAGVMRNVAKNVAMEEPYNITVKPEELKTILGAAKYSNDIYNEKQAPGVAVGLAWTSVGGEILFIEVSLSSGKGSMTMTGNLGSVMKESATTAMSYIKANSEAMGIDSKHFETKDVHIHVPEGAIPKDGPSAGITMLTALTSAFTKQPVKEHLAMTGEITLRGRILPVGGIKEKMLAAKRTGMTDIILCKVNEKNVAEINPEFIKGMTFHYVDQMQDVLKIALPKV